MEASSETDVGSVNMSTTIEKTARLDSAIQKLATYIRLVAAGRDMLAKKGFLTPKLDFRLGVEEGFGTNVLLNMFMLTNEFVAELFDNVDRTPNFEQNVERFCEALTGKKMSQVLITPDQFQQAAVERKNKTLMSKFGRRQI